MTEVYAKPNCQDFIGSIDGDEENGYTVKVFGDDHSMDGMGFVTEDDAFEGLLTATGYFFSHYELKFQSPITIKLATPMYWIRRAMAMNITVVQEGQQHNTPLNATQQYICDKFGPDCRVALSIARAESNDNCNEINVNTNGTVDFGIFMENSIHLNRQFTFADLASCQTQIDAAYKLFKAQGWTPWTSYVSGSYKKFLY